MKQKEVLILPKAQASLEPILEYLLFKWTIKEHNNFIDDILKIIKHIELFPKSFPISHKEKIRKVIINKQIALFYLEKENRIEILLFWDMRQNPKKLKL